MRSAAPAAAAAATERGVQPRPVLLLLCAALVAGRAAAGVLDDDRADVMYHRYDGGGVTIHGPSLLVRKKFREKYAVNAAYYVDMVSSASIDVVKTASPYTERRNEYGLGFEYLRGKITYRVGFADSEENDYEANTARASISQDFFGDLTTVTLAFARGWDRVFRRGDDLCSRTGSTAASTVSTSRRWRRATCCSACPGKRSPRRDSSTTPSARCATSTRQRRAASLSSRSATRARARATRWRSAAAASCPAGRHCRASTASTPTPETSAGTPPSSAARIPRASAGPSTCATASTRRTRRISMPTSSRSATSRTSSRATRSCRR